MLAAACQMFLGKSESEVAHIALETLEGHQRAIMAHMTVEVSCDWNIKNCTIVVKFGSRIGADNGAAFIDWYLGKHNASLF